MNRIICLLLLTAGIANALKLGLGGKNRGSSAARMNMHSQHHAYQPQRGGFHQQQQAGYQAHQGGHYPPQPGYQPHQGGHYPPQQGGYNPQHGNYQQQGYHQPMPGGYHPNQVGGYHQQGGFAPNQMRSSNRRAFGTAFVGGALGAAAGLATFELGKAILRSSSEPLRTPNGQNYYFDERNHQSKSGYFMCSMPIDDVVKILQENSTPAPATSESTNSTNMTPVQFFKAVQFNDGSRPKSLTWNCKTGTEVCCGTDCCEAQPLMKQQNTSRGGLVHHGRPSWVICTSILVLLVTLCC